MKRFTPYWPYLIFLFIWVLFGIWGYVYHPTFFNSNFFFASVTSIVGSLAIYLYIRQKSDYKSNAARILFLELKESEKQLKKLIEYKITTAGATYSSQNIVKLIQNRAWAAYSHLFIENFNNDEYQQLDEYFKKCDVLEKYFEKQHEFFWVATEERARQVETLGARLAFENSSMSEPNFDASLAAIEKLYYKTIIYAPSAITIEINKQLDGIIFPSNTPLWSKLKELAGYTN